MIEILLIKGGFVVKATGYFFLMLMIMMGCSEKMNMEYVDKDNDIKMIKAEAIEAFKRKKIFFGHASVGSNIIDGIEDIRANNQHVQNINIQDLKEDNEVNEPAIYHAQNGKNGFPKSKVDAFKKTLEEKGLGNKLDIAFFKLCYVDIEKDSNVQEMFDYYTSNMEYLKKKFPRLQFVHVTTPLYSHSRGIKGFIKNIIRGDVSNVKRNEFNKMLIKKATTIKSKTSDLPLLLTLLIIIILSNLIGVYNQDFSYDCPIIFEGGYRILKGQIPYRDFYIPTGPVVYYIQALFSYLFGLNLISLAMHTSTMAIILSLYFFYILNKDFNRFISFIFAYGIYLSFCGITNFPWYTTSAFLFLLLNILLLIKNNIKIETTNNIANITHIVNCAFLFFSLSSFIFLSFFLKFNFLKIFNY